MIVQNAERYDVSPTLLAALIRQESNYNSSARSPTGAIGLTQIVRLIGASLVLAIFMMKILILIAVHISYRPIIRKSAGSWSKAVAYYNVGPSGYERSFWTRHKGKKYARSVKRHEKILKKPYKIKSK